MRLWRRRPRADWRAEYHQLAAVRLELRIDNGAPLIYATFGTLAAVARFGGVEPGKPRDLIQLGSDAMHAGIQLLVTLPTDAQLKWEMEEHA